jgi:mycothiol system anti-sigma-R factor
MAEGNCNDALHELYHYLDGQLDDARRTAIKHHLDDCPPCYEAFDFELDLRIVIAKRCHETVPDHLKQRIADALAHEPSHPDSAS